MSATAHVVARFRAKVGKEAALKSVLTGLIAPSRREIGCYQYDLLVNPADPRDFCFVERWENDRAVDVHSHTEHFKAVVAQIEGLVEEPPDIRRYEIV